MPALGNPVARQVKTLVSLWDIGVQILCGPPRVESPRAGVFYFHSTLGSTNFARRNPAPITSQNVSIDTLPNPKRIIFASKRAMMIMERIFLWIMVRKRPSDYTLQ